MPILFNINSYLLYIRVHLFQLEILLPQQTLINYQSIFNKQLFDRHLSHLYWWYLVCSKVNLISGAIQIIINVRNYIQNIIFQMKPGGAAKPNPLDEIKKIQLKREERRKKMQEDKILKQEKKAYNLASGKNVDIDFEIMIQKSKFRQKLLSPHVSSMNVKLAVCVRKRPIFKKQQQNGEIDSISCANPQIKVHEPKFKVDGITKYVENHTFTFDNTFNEQEGTQDIYKVSLKPLLPLLVDNGIVTCFAYGQTGSGKTFTMNGLQQLVVAQTFELIKKKYTATVSFFEIYGGRCLDLLNNKQALNILEDKSNNIIIQGLTEKDASDAKELLAIMSIANASRTTHATVANDTSSRSHAICQVQIKKGADQIGKLVLVDLAGSERAQDTQSNNRQRRMQGAQINKSLLALKECIRAMDDKADHIPFRASKLTLILRDSFTSKADKSKVIMIACISPGSSSADHSLNTLRYADRLKDNSELNQMYNKMVEENRKNDPNEIQISREQIQKINSAKNIKKQKQDNSASKSVQPISNNSGASNNQKAVITPQNKIPSNLPKSANSGANIKKQQPKKQEIRKDESRKEEPKKQDMRKKQEDKKGVRSTSVKKTINTSKNSDGSKKQNEKNEIVEQIDIQDQITGQRLKEKEKGKKKVKDDVSAMKRTMKNENKEEYFAFQEKVANILEQQEEVFATHMAAIKEDAKLLTQESQLISKIQGENYVDYDVDTYVQKLQGLIKKKLKIYNLLSKKLDGFKKVLKEEDQIRHKVKDTFYY